MNVVDRKPPERSGRRRWAGRLGQFGLFLLLLAAVTTVSDAWRSRAVPDQGLPDWPLHSLEGETIDLDSLSAEGPVLVYFWATWCGVCKLVSPTVDWLADDYTVISVALTSGDSRRVARYMTAKGYHFPVVNDPRGELARAWGISATPSIAVIRNGEISSFTVGITTPPGLLARLWWAS